MQKKILIIRDADASITLRACLTNAGFEMRELSELSQTVSCALEFMPVLAIFLTSSWNRTLESAIWELRSLNRTRSIRKIVLAQGYRADDSVAALEAGADDFIASPISDRELVARIRSVLRSLPARPSEEDVQTLGSLCLHTEGMEVSFGGERTKLTRREFALLSYLLERPRHVVSRDELLENLWYPSGEAADSRTIDVYIWRLREKIEDDPTAPRWLLTRRGEGYALIDPDK
jgi:DNA-binding response OmpR family regulator